MYTPLIKVFVLFQSTVTERTIKLLKRQAYVILSSRIHPLAVEKEPVITP